MIIPNQSDLNAATCRAVSFQKRWPDFYMWLQSNYADIPLSQQLYMYYNKLTSIPVCVVCGGPVKFLGFNAGWRRTCCSRCAGKDPETKKKKEDHSLKKYGVKNPAQSQIVKEKTKQTCLKKYGTTNAGWTEQSQIKIKKTNLERYGVEHPMQSKIIQEKSKQTCLQKYGVEHNTSDPNIKQKISATNKIRYGGTGYASKHLMEKVLQTCADRFGYASIINPSQIPEIQSRILRTKRENVLLSHEDILGYTGGGDWICKCPHPECAGCQERTYMINPSIKRNRERIGAETCTNLLPVKSQHSTMELWICNILNGCRVSYELGNREVLGGKEIDIYIPDLKIGIECNGCYWHSDLFKDSKYHINKTHLARENGIRLYHIWEDWYLNKPEIIESMIKNWIGCTCNKIYARKCLVAEVPYSECAAFEDHNHIQGKSKHAIAYGLYYENNLVSLMTFSKKRGCVGSTAGEEGWELVRFCSKLNTNVIGGAGKLFNHFLKVHNPDVVYSYASCDISVGDLYMKLGFTSDGNISNSYWYIDPTTFNRLHRSGFTRSQISKKWPEYDINDKSWTESKVMKVKGYWKIWDAGMLKFVYRNL